jgi:light-regulated signal transduction histidine kinase (bacteriophytochrome)
LVFDEFIRDAVKNLARAYQARYAFVGVLIPDTQQVQTLAVWAGDDFAENFTYKLKGSACQDVLDKKLEFIPCDAKQLYPGDELLREMGIEAYFGSPLISSEYETLGLIALMDVAPMKMEKWVEPILSLFSSRIAMEMERHKITDELEVYRHDLERLVKERTARMEQLNKELESFCYSVSHDLRAPLRSINGFTSALMEDYVDAIDDQGMDYLSRVCGGANRMSELIDALLDVSRVTRAEPVLEHVDMGQLAHEVVDELHMRNPDRHVDVDIQQDMNIVADRRFIKIILENLLENAWKYTSKKAKAEITVGLLKRDGEDVYFVRDDGAGFDMRYAGKLFEAFQRLHQQDEFAGTGIGLATVQKIIHQHSGRIWADASPGKGATFYFTLAPVHLLNLNSSAAC